MKSRFFIHIALRPYCLKVLNNGHPGVTKMTLRVQSSMLWSGISKQIAKYIHPCVPCQTISNSQQKESAIPKEVPCRPWQVLGMDFYMHKHKWYLLGDDYYCKFPCIVQMSSMASKDVISALSFCFSVFGPQRKSSMTMQKMSPTEKTRNLLPTGDSPSHYKQFPLPKGSWLH